MSPAAAALRPATAPDPREAFRSDVLQALRRRPRRIAPKHFYDGRGSALFEAICALPEYYLTRTELAIMQAHAGAMAARLGPGLRLVELGPGSGAKTCLLLARLRRPAAYVPVDVSPAALAATAAALRPGHPRLPITPVCADFTAPLCLPPLPGLRTAVYFPGSTIGNLDPPEARRLLRRLRRLAGPGGACLVGVDTKKDPAVLRRAYDDAQGVTAAFNLNLLARINRELDGDFELEAFRHQARYDTGAGRVEMHLVSRRDQIARVAGQCFSFRRGEAIHTESSYKYAPDEFATLAAEAGWRHRAAWLDGARRFGVHLLD